MDNGIYAEMSNNDYHSDKNSISTSLIKTMGRSFAHANQAMEEKKEPTPAMLLGTVFHCLTLEPDAFSRDFAIAPVVNKRTKAGKAVPL